MASLSSWTVHLSPTSYIPKNKIQVESLRDLLAIGFPTCEPNEILIWGWKSGTLLNRVNIEGTCSFGFLTSNCLSVFNCTDPWDLDHSIGLFIYNDIRERPVGAPTIATDAWVATDYTALSPAVELEIPSRSAYMRNIIQHSTGSQRNPSASSSSAFRISQDPSVIHLTMSFCDDMDGTAWDDFYDIFVSKSKLLEYTEGLAPSTRRLRRIDWGDWGEDSTRWFHSESLVGFDSGRWMMEGTRAIGTNYLEQEDHYQKSEYVSLLDFHPPTVRRFPNVCGKYRSTSMWAGVEIQHVDLDSSEEDRLELFKFMEDEDYGSGVFVDVIDEHTPAFTEGFEGGTIVSRLPYRTVTRKVPTDGWSRWALDEDRIIEVPVSPCTSSAKPSC